MARFMVYRIPNPETRVIYPLLLDVQTDLIAELNTRVVVSLCPAAAMKGKLVKTLMPVFEIDGEQYVMFTPQLAGISKKQVGRGSRTWRHATTRSLQHWTCSSPGYERQAANSSWFAPRRGGQIEPAHPSTCRTAVAPRRACGAGAAGIISLRSPCGEHPMNQRILPLLLPLFWAGSAQAAFFMDTNALMHLLPDYEAYQDKREIRYMAKASQFIGYVTGIVDGMDGTKFCLPGAVNAEQASDVVAGYLRNPGSALPRKAADTVGDALASRYPCTH